MNLSSCLRFSLLAAALALVACGGNNNNQNNTPGADAGTGGGSGMDAGTGSGSDGGSGLDAGSMNDAGTGQDAGTTDGGLTACTPGSTDCAAGQSCMYLDQNGSAQQAYCVAGACDLVQQNCTGGQACNYAQTGGTTERACVQAGTADVGQACSQTGCLPGLTCVNMGGQTACAKYCYTDADCPAQQACLAQLAPAGSNERPTVCVPKPATCDVLAQDCADPAQGCYVSQNGPVCVTAGTVPVGQPCATALCVKGATCVGLQDGGTECAALCGYPNTQPTCSSGQCAQLNTQSGPVLDGGVGVCM